MKRGQISSEYLVVMAIVLVIALVVVFLLKDFLTAGAGVSESQSRNYWTVASPFSISAQKYAGTTLQLDMQNTLSETAGITGIEIEGTAYSVSETFRLGERKVVTLTLADACGTVGSAYSLDNVLITYQRAGSTVTQRGSVPLAGSCS